MKFEACKSGDKLSVVLPKVVVSQLGWTPGDILSAEVVDGGLKIVQVQTFHDRAMEIARRGFVKYRETFEALAKS